MSRPLLVALACCAACASGGANNESGPSVNGPSTPGSATAGAGATGSVANVSGDGMRKGWPTQPGAAPVGSGAPSGSAGAMGSAGAVGSSGSAGAVGSSGSGGSSSGAAGTMAVAPLDGGMQRDPGNAAPNGQRWQPKPGTSWQWQLTGTLDQSLDVQVYDIDLYETSAAEITALHADGRKVICYFDTAYEPSRPDSKQLEPFRGNPIDGWPGQYWVDFREDAVVAVMKARIALAATKKCDGIEADDIDARSNDPGFSISAAEQRAFIRALADAAHQAGLAYGLKNDLEDIDALLAVSDFAINEECFQYDECDTLAPFIDAGKAVFQVEYSDGDLAQKGASICPKANAQNFDTLIKHLDLDAPRFACR